MKVAVCQMTATSDREANYATCARLIVESAALGATLVCLPECFHFIGAAAEESVAIAEPVEGPAIARYGELARAHGVWLSLGGFQEVAEAEAAGDGGSGVSGRIHNTHVVLAPSGEVVSVYRKVHLFDAPLVGLRESRLTRPGADACVVCEGTPGGSLGLSVCYDLRFPELYGGLRRAGAHTLLVPSAFTVPTGQAHWEILLRARAVETQCYVVAAAQVGRHNEKRESFGRAMIVDPWGTIVAEVAGGAGVAVAEVDLDLVESTRTKMPVATHARPDLFGASF